MPSIYPEHVHCETSTLLYEYLVESCFESPADYLNYIDNYKLSSVILTVFRSIKETKNTTEEDKGASKHKVSLHQVCYFLN